MVDPSLARACLCYYIGTYFLNSSLLLHFITILTIIVNRLIIIWVLSTNGQLCLAPVNLFEWWDFGAFCVVMLSPGTCSTMWWLVTLWSCAVLLMTEPHVRPSHSLVVHIHGGGLSKTFIRWPSGEQMAGISTLRRCQLTCGSYLLSHSKNQV